MEGLMNFTGFIIIAFGIMQIILFFKIWGMTNNVNRIWKKIDSKDFLSEACITYIKGDLEETNKLANEAFLQEVAMLSKSSNAYADWEDGKAFYPGYKVKEVVDTVGAGDGFAVGILSAWLEGLQMPEMVDRGNAIGSIQVSVASDNEGLPTKEELDAYMKGAK